MVAFLDTLDVDNWQENQEAWKQLHEKYTAGENLEEALGYIGQLNQQGKRALLSSLGEKSQTTDAALAKTRTYCTALQEITRLGLYATISVKLSDLGLRKDGQGYELAKRNMEQILRSANGQVVEIDIEYRDLVDNTVKLANELLQKGYSFKLAMQSALKDAKQYAQQLMQTAEQTQGNIGFRNVTGSCYKKNGNGYRTTLENNEAETIRQFYDLIKLSADWGKNGGLQSAVGTAVKNRIIAAAQGGLELQFLKGEEETEAYKLAEALQKEGADFAVYVGFGKLSDAGVRAYLKRRTA